MYYANTYCSGVCQTHVSDILSSHSYPLCSLPSKSRCVLSTDWKPRESPRRNLPKASKRYFYRLIAFYVLGVLAIGVICPSNAAALTDGGAGAGSSPFVVGIANAGISTLPSIVNAVIIISAWSSGNSFLYISSRSLYSLAIQGSAPRIFKACNRWGVPYYAVGVSSLFASLAYLNCASDGSVVFNWFVVSSPFPQNPCSRFISREDAVVLQPWYPNLGFFSLSLPSPLLQ